MRANKRIFVPTEVQLTIKPIVSFVFDWEFEMICDSVQFWTISFCMQWLHGFQADIFLLFIL